jgi:DNA-binding MarR family transcriptional regulator
VRTILTPVLLAAMFIVRTVRLKLYERTSCVANLKTPQSSLDQEEQITLNLLDMVEENSAITQRSLAAELGVALGLTNTYIKRCTKKGLIKVSQVPSNRYAYYLTPSGFAEKSRLTAEYLKQSFNFFRLARRQSGKLLQHCVDRGWTRIALTGKSDLTEITILSAAELEIKLAGIIDAKAATTTSAYMHLPVVSMLSQLGTLNALIITDMKKPQDTFNKAVQFFPRDKVLAVPILGVSRERDEQTSNPMSHLGGSI